MTIFYAPFQSLRNITWRSMTCSSTAFANTTALGRARAAVAAIAVALLAACGGGGGGEAPAASPSANTNPGATTDPLAPPATCTPPQVSLLPYTTPQANLPAASTLANQCQADCTGTLETEKSWLRSHFNDTYLWYKDVPQVDPAPFTAASYSNSSYRALNAYLQALKTPKITASGKKVDQFSFTLPTADLVSQQSGVATGYGIRFTVISNVVPRIFRVLFVEPGSPAEGAGILRGDTVRSVDGVSVDDNTTEGRATLNAGLSPRVASKVTVFGMQAPSTPAGTPASTPRLITVTSSRSITVTPVPTSTTLTQGTSTVGYLVLNSFSVFSAEKQLIDAVTQLKAANINELVLDLRYNGGGFLDISNELAYMIGDGNLSGKVYEKINCNDKNPFAICNTQSTFRATSRGFAPQSEVVALPQLGLKRVFVLTSASTCSASESLINGLSPFMTVVRIGSGTCGKPYGFYYASNCGTSYAAMQFSGQNSVGFGDYADGFAPTCQVGDDLSKPRGDASERMLSAALGYISTGACPTSSTGLQKSTVSVLDTGNYRVMRSPVEEQRWLGGPAAP